MTDRVSEAQAYKSLIPQTTERLESASQNEGTRDGEMETKADEELGPVSVRTRVSIPMPDGSLQGSILGPVAAILMQILVAIVLALTSTVKMILVYYDSEALPGEMPATYHTLYVVGITIAATIISIFTTGQIRRLWVGIRHESLVDGNATDVYPRGFAVLLGLGSIPAQFLEYRMTLSLTVASLLTTAIVAGLSPKSVLVDYPFKTKFYVSRNMTADQCYTQRVNITSVASDWFTWKTANSTLSIQGAAPYTSRFTGYNGYSWSVEQLSNSYTDKCETKWVLPALMNAAATPSDYSYALGGVAVGASALGTPFDPTHYTFFTTFGDYENVFRPGDVSATMCLPVLAGNPVSCSRSGPGSKLEMNQTVLSVQTPRCNITSPPLLSNPKNAPGAVVAGACTGDGAAVGTATVVVGATSEYAWILAEAFTGTEGEDPDSADGQIIVCDVDVREAVQFRQVTITRLGTSLWTSGFSNPSQKAAYSITGDDEHVCVARDPGGNEIPTSAFLPDTALATAAGASWQLLAENRDVQGYLDTLFDATQAADGMTIQDTLRAASGIALGMYWGRSKSATDVLVDEAVEIAGGMRGRLRVRIGSGELWALLYCIPPVFSATVLLCLLWKSKI